MGMLGITSINKKKNGTMKLKIVVKKLRKSLSINRRDYDRDQDLSDVKEGHFSVVAMKGDEFKRFVVPLSFLHCPSFLRLLEETAEEYGFEHRGALTVPCSPVEFERLIVDASAEQWQKKEERSKNGVELDSYFRVMLQSY